MKSSVALVIAVIGVAGFVLSVIFALYIWGYGGRWDLGVLAGAIAFLGLAIYGVRNYPK